MTKEKAIKIIKDCKEKRFKHTFCTVNEYEEAMDMAIEALRREDACNSINIKMVTNAKEAEEYKISEDISKGFEKFTELIYRQGEKERESEKK
ncbi:MAG: hypothetical protein IJP92_00700 [Lachnospiraceae bacterium]|nr:hypothetical protein [Lachnospiraceae bacterium]